MPQPRRINFVDEQKASGNTANQVTDDDRYIDNTLASCMTGSSEPQSGFRSQNVHVDTPRSGQTHPVDPDNGRLERQVYAQKDDNIQTPLNDPTNTRKTYHSNTPSTEYRVQGGETPEYGKSFQQIYPTDLDSTEQSLTSTFQTRRQSQKHSMQNNDATIEQDIHGRSLSSYGGSFQRIGVSDLATSQDTGNDKRQSVTNHFSDEVRKETYNANTPSYVQHVDRESHERSDRPGITLKDLSESQIDTQQSEFMIKHPLAIRNQAYDKQGQGSQIKANTNGDSFKNSRVKDMATTWKTHALSQPAMQPQDQSLPMQHQTMTSQRVTSASYLANQDPYSPGSYGGTCREIDFGDLAPSGHTHSRVQSNEISSPIYSESDVSNVQQRDPMENVGVSGGQIQRKDMPSVATNHQPQLRMQSNSDEKRVEDETFPNYGRKYGQKENSEPNQQKGPAVHSPEQSQTQFRYPSELTYEANKPYSRSNFQEDSSACYSGSFQNIEVDDLEANEQMEADTQSFRKPQAPQRPPPPQSTINTTHQQGGHTVDPKVNDTSPQRNWNVLQENVSRKRNGGQQQQFAGPTSMPPQYQQPPPTQSHPQNSDFAHQNATRNWRVLKDQIPASYGNSLQKEDMREISESRTTEPDAQVHRIAPSQSVPAHMLSTERIRPSSRNHFSEVQFGSFREEYPKHSTPVHFYENKVSRTSNGMSSRNQDIQQNVPSAQHNGVHSYQSSPIDRHHGSIGGTTSKMDTTFTSNSDNGFMANQEQRQPSNRSPNANAVNEDRSLAEYIYAPIKQPPQLSNNRQSNGFHDTQYVTNHMTSDLDGIENDPVLAGSFKDSLNSTYNTVHTHPSSYNASLHKGNDSGRHGSSIGVSFNVSGISNVSEQQERYPQRGMEVERVNQTQRDMSNKREDIKPSLGPPQASSTPRPSPRDNVFFSGRKQLLYVF